MDIIELERWKPSEANPHKLEYAGQPVAQEVFEELKHRLEGMGYLPDEYFLLDDHWKDGREIPKDADIFCTTDSAPARVSIWMYISSGMRMESPSPGASSPARLWVRTATIWTGCSSPPPPSPRRSTAITPPTPDT